MASPVGSVRSGVNVRDVAMEIEEETCCCCCPFFGSKKKPSVAAKVQDRANVELRPAARTESEVRAEQPAAAGASMSVDEQPPVPYPAAAAAAGTPVQQAQLNVAKLSDLDVLRWKVVEDIMDKVFEKVGNILGEEIDWCHKNIEILADGSGNLPKGAAMFELPLNKDGSRGGFVSMRVQCLLDKYTKNLEAREAALVGHQKRCYEAVLGRIQEMQKGKYQDDCEKVEKIFPTTWRLSRIEPQAAAGNSIKSKLVRSLLVDIIEQLYSYKKDKFDKLFS